MVILVTMVLLLPGVVVNMIPASQHFFGRHFGQTTCQATTVLRDVFLVKNLLSFEAKMMSQVMNRLRLHPHLVLFVEVALLHQPGNHGVKNKFVRGLLYNGGSFNHHEERGFFRLNHHGHEQSGVHHVVKQGTNVKWVHRLESIGVHHGRSKRSGAISHCMMGSAMAS